MGMIIDLESPVAMLAINRAVRKRKTVPSSGLNMRLRPAVNCAPCRRKLKPDPRIETDTPIVPRAVAVSVWAEARAWLNEELPVRWIDLLTDRAQRVYARRAGFRRKIRRKGDLGRDSLWVFTRHWLAALIREHRPEWHTRLPQRYKLGGGLASCLNESLAETVTDRS